MTSDRIARIYALFCAARERPPAERQEFLERECGVDDALLREILEMLNYAEQSGGILSNPPWKADPAGWRVFAADQIIEDRFQVVRFIGLGGMGEVYEAYDRRLNCRVALKTIRPEIAANEQAVTRFLREVQLQQEVSHENVCRLFDVHHHKISGGEGIYFLTMQYLAGETLSEKLKRDGRMTCSEAARLALQIAAGLDAAHRANILHRDLKSANVMLCPTPEGGLRAVITDFGLARRIVPSDRENTLTRTGEPLGTLDYMSPELLAGGKATLASEIYALGTVVYEMLTGERPYGEDPSNVAAYKRSQRPPPVRQKLPGLDRGWESAIVACLDPDPSRRPQLAALVATLGGPASVTPASPALALGPSDGFIGRLVRRVAFPWTGRTRLLAGILLAVSLFAAAFRYYLRPPKIIPGAYMYVSEMANATQDPDLDIAGELLRSQLRQSGYVRLVDEAKVARVKALMAEGGRDGSSPEVSREIALRTSAALVLSTTLMRKGTGFALYVDMEQVGDSPLSIRKHWSNEFAASSKSQIFAGIKESADWIRSHTGEAASDLAERSVAPEEAASSSWEALRLLRDTEQLRRQRAKNPGTANPDATAVAKLEQALDLDPGFALAHLRLADILLGRKEQKSAFTHLSSAVAAGSRRRLTKWEELRARGTLAIATGEYRTAEGVFGELRALYPAESVPAIELASALEYQGRLNEALELHREAVRKDPNASPPLVGLFNVYVLQNRLDEAETAAHQLKEIGAPGLSSQELGIVRFLKGDVQGAHSLFDSAIRDNSPSQRSSGYSLLGSLLAETGKYGEALAELQKGITQDETDGLSGQKIFKLVAKASILMRQGDFQKATDECENALRLIDNLEIKRRAATMLARMGRFKGAEEVLGELETEWKGPLAEAAAHQIRGEVLLARQSFDAATREFQAADRLDPLNRSREYLARSYAQKGDWERAFSVYESVLRERGVFWQYQDCDLPGIRTSILLDFAKVARSAGRREQSVTSLREYFEVRPNADPALPETRIARELAQ